MKLHPQRAIVFVLLALLGLAIAGIYLTRNSAGPAPARSAAAGGKPQPLLVDQQPLITAQKLALLAITPDEQELADAAVRVADHEVDLAFDYALRHASERPPELSPEARALAERIKEIETRVTEEQAEVDRLKAILAKAGAGKKDALAEQFELRQTQLELHHDELEDAHQDLIRAGGDPQGAVQHQLDEHEASSQHQNAAIAATRHPHQEYEDTESHSAFAEFLAWRELSSKQKKIFAALEEVRVRNAELTARHDHIERDSEQLRATGAAGAGGAAPSASRSSDAKAAMLSSLQRRKRLQQAMAAIDKRIQDFQELSKIYGRWDALIAVRQRGYLNGFLWSGVWILLIGLMMILAEPGIHRFYTRLAPEHRKLHTLRTVVRFGVRAVGILLILLVVFGPPSQLATIIALTGAGLTVALKNFIVGFFGWFVLMGRNGIHPGDWVEINGVGGEVLEVGLLHTVLLETGNWSDSGHPTGRKVTFVNSFAIEGHYFNFSTAGQWLWDELEVLLPADADPYATAEEVQKIAAAATKENAQLAEQEWQRAVQSRLPANAQKGFSAEPVMSIRPGNLGVTVYLRYIARVQERHELRSRLYREVVELLHRKQVAGEAS